jgi:hypothetical protein
MPETLKGNVQQRRIMDFLAAFFLRELKEEYSDL